MNINLDELKPDERLSNQQAADMGRCSGDTNAQLQTMIHKQKAAINDSEKHLTGEMKSQRNDLQRLESVDGTQDLGAATYAQSTGFNAVEAALERGGSVDRLAAYLVGTALELTVLPGQSDEEQ